MNASSKLVEEGASLMSHCTKGFDCNGYEIVGVFELSTSPAFDARLPWPPLLLLPYVPLHQGFRLQWVRNIVGVFKMRILHLLSMFRCSASLATAPASAVAIER